MLKIVRKMQLTVDIFFIFSFIKVCQRTIQCYVTAGDCQGPRSQAGETLPGAVLGCAELCWPVHDGRPSLTVRDPAAFILGHSHIGLTHQDDIYLLLSGHCLQHVLGSDATVQIHRHLLPCFCLSNFTFLFRRLKDFPEFWTGFRIISVSVDSADGAPRVVQALFGLVIGRSTLETGHTAVFILAVTGHVTELPALLHLVTSILSCILQTARPTRNFSFSTSFLARSTANLTTAI
jgi:hypothetical protein